MILLTTFDPMENIINPGINASVNLSSMPPSRAPRAAGFDDVLTRLVDIKKSHQIRAKRDQQVILVGEISREKPTVSDLLINHQELRGSTWDIIHSAQNQNKDYRNIKPGTRIYYNQDKGNLEWSHPGQATIPAEKDNLSSQTQISAPNLSIPQISPVNHSANSPDRPLENNSLPPVAQTQLQDADNTLLTSKNNHFISLGKIDNTNPTVSHLLKNNPQLRKHTWNLLANNINKGKPFNRITDGTEIYIDAGNMEITWNGGPHLTSVSNLDHLEISKPLHLNANMSPAADNPKIDLSDAVQNYFGRSYDEIDCYELLVKGLDHMDIPYAGKNGLFAKLTTMARDDGMPDNSYLNGEGIIKAAGSLVLSKSYSDISNWKDLAETLINEISPVLNKGQILAFSTEKRGHTGIVSQRNNQWTFINSGRLDNPVVPNSVHQGVGEEILKEEINNWFKLAQTKGETLSITLGRLEQGRIHTAFNGQKSFTKRI